MKRKVFGFLSAVLMVASFSITCAASTGNGSATPAQNTSEGKPLVVYFSRTGNTKTIAGIISGQVGGDLIELVPTTAYPTDYDVCVDIARKELDQQTRPTLKTTIADMASYDTVYVGYPIWWSTIPMPVATFLESYDFSGKTVVPFCTHAGSGLANSVSDIQKLVPNATVTTGFAASGSSASSATSNVTTWLSTIQTIQPKTEIAITITIGDTVIEARLNNTSTARDVISALPLTINAKDWEDKAYYGRIRSDNEISTTGAQHNQIKARDIVYWIDGKAMMLYYDETKNTNITTPVITIGSITSNPAVFNNMDDATEIQVAVKK